MCVNSTHVSVIAIQPSTLSIYRSNGTLSIHVCIVSLSLWPLIPFERIHLLRTAIADQAQASMILQPVYEIILNNTHYMYRSLQKEGEGCRLLTLFSALHNMLLGLLTVSLTLKATYTVPTNIHERSKTAANGFRAGWLPR